MNNIRVKYFITLIAFISLSFFSSSSPKVVWGSNTLYLAQQGSPWQTNGGSWNFSGTPIFGQGTSDFNKAFLLNSIFTDFVYEVRLRKISPNDGPIGLLMRYNEQRDEGYMLLIWPHGDYQFSRLVNQERFRIGSGTPTDLNKGNSWNVLKVIGKGSIMAIYINGNHLVNLNASEYSSGRLGLVIHGGPDQQAEFTILTLSAL